MLKLYQGNCIEVMDRLISEGVTVDAIICDPPYGTTACKWDVVIPVDQMWQRLKRIVGPGGVCVLTANLSFASVLIMGNREWYRYDWVWVKNRSTGFLNAQLRPLVKHEHIIVFSKNRTVYNPQMKGGAVHKRGSKSHKGSDNYRQFERNEETESCEYYPVSVLEVDCQSESCVTFSQKPDRLKTHPTQKPVALMEYLIKTYTNEGDTVLDFTMGSGTTGVACKQTNRNFIGIERDDKYFAIAQSRISQAVFQPELFS